MMNSEKFSPQSRRDRKGTQRRSNLGFNPKTEIEPRMARMARMARIFTDYERVMETIFKPVWCILISVKIRAIRGQNSNEYPCNFGVRIFKFRA
jgi:hypothetical protein